ncbi:MAG TPA: VIT and VWA domain-containing protein [Blastocatellia bacterium]|nr:VIT and VWA domain-containing protein [Blastocatellia bacterium]
MFNQRSYENTRPDGFGVLEIVDEKEPHLFVPLRRTELRGEVTGPLASLRLTQVYGYSRAQCERTLEAVYRFPLPGDAAVTSVRVTFGEVEISAELKERTQAEADYEAAKREGRQAALATRESPDVFTLRVAGLQPDQEVRVETAYVQSARAEGIGWSLRIPLTTAPRYVRSDELTSRHAHGQPLALLRDPGHRFALDLNVRGAAAVQSRTHQLTTTAENDGVRVQLQEGEVIPDRDCVLVWQPRQEVARPALQVFLHDDPDEAQLYFLALLAPPAADRTRRGIPREAILLVDHSGSMEGAKWAAADWAVKSFLYGLSERDEFALGFFHNTTRWFASQLTQATGEAVEKAVRFLEMHRDSGGTELGIALEQALSLPRSRGERARHVLMITDAEVTDAGRILRLADEESQRRDQRRLSVLCIDAAPNSHLVMELAERGGGIAKFLTSSPAEEDITTALDEVLADWAEPVLTGLRLEVNRQVAQAAGRSVRSGSESGWSAIDLGDLPAGRSVFVTGRVPRGNVADLTFRVLAGRDSEVADGHVVRAENHPAIKALFGARRVPGLEFLISSGYEDSELHEQLVRLGYDASEVSLSPAQRRVYAENVREDAHKALRDLLVREALRYGLASSETAFVATRKEAGKVIDASVIVANALPAGWSENFVAFCAGRSTMAPAAPMAMLYAPPEDARRSATDALSGWNQIRAFFGRDASTQADDDVSFAASVSEPEIAAPPARPAPSLFSGLPVFSGSEAVLFDSERDASRVQLPEYTTIRSLIVHFPDASPKADEIDAGLSVQIFVDDLSIPRAKVRLADLMRQRGERPLNLQKVPGQRLRIVLVDPAGAWRQINLRLDLALEWD